MSTITVSTKGQVVIPLPLRRALGIVPGTLLEARLSSDGSTVHLQPMRPRKKGVPVQSLFGRIKHSGPPVSIDQISGREAAKRMTKRGALKK